MRPRSLLPLLLVLMCATGCNVAVIGNLAVFALSVGIFLGTLSLGTPPPARRSDGTGPDAQPLDRHPEDASASSDIEKLC